jgi:hypothetical protein
VGVTVWVVCLIVGLGSVIGKHSPEALAQQAKQQAEQAELAKAKQIAEAELFERRRKSPQFRKEVAQLALARQFPGECGAEAQFAEVSGGFHVRCSYGETFMVAGGLAMRCVVQGVNVCIGLK